MLRLKLQLMAVVIFMGVFALVMLALGVVGLQKTVQARPNCQTWIEKADAVLARAGRQVTNPAITSLGIMAVAYQQRYDLCVRFGE